MKVKTGELCGPALNLAVARASGYEVMLFDDLWRANASAKGYPPDAVEGHLGWQPQRGQWVIVELRHLQLDQRHPDITTPTRCARSIPDYQYDWVQGGPIIEREGIATYVMPGGAGGLWRAEWHSANARGAPIKSYSAGPTPLIAAMRCLVASKFGDEVEIPEELF